MSAALHTGGSLAYLMPPAPAYARRLLVLLHGVGGNETNLLPLAMQLPADTRVLLARAPLTLGAAQYAWFPVSFGAQGPRPDLAAAEQSRQTLAAFVAEMQAEHGIAPEHTVVAGFSQGGIMSASLALTQPARIAGFGILAGRILPELEPQLADRDALARVHGFIGHGRDDSKLPVEWAYRADAWLTELGVPHELRLYPGDHGITAAMQAEFLAWFASLTSHATSVQG